jgi:hypothetical protein
MHLFRAREVISDSDLGLRIQGLVALALVGLGGIVHQVNGSGHPDIEGLYENRAIRAEVEADLGGWRPRMLGTADLEGLMPRTGNGSSYYILVLCSGLPELVVVNYEILARREGRALRISTLQALRDKALSGRWTEEFCRQVALLGDRLHLYTFAFLRGLAISGKTL